MTVYLEDHDCEVNEAVLPLTLRGPRQGTWYQFGLDLEEDCSVSDYIID